MTGGPLRAEHTVAFSYRRSVGGAVERFLRGLARGEIWGSRVADGRVVVPPTDDGSAGDPVRVGDAGVVRSWTWVPDPGPEHPLDRPFAFALVQLDGADTALVHVVDVADEGEMATGLRVRADWRPERVGSILDVRAFVPGEPGPAPAAASSELPEVVEVVADVRLEYAYEPGLALSGFLRSLGEGRIEGGRCPSCTKVYVPPRSRCPACAAGPMAPVALGDVGTIVSYTVVHLPFHGMELELPFAWAWIRLDGADVPFAHLLGEVAPHDVHVGQRVEAVWVPAAERAPTWESIRHFRPLEAERTGAFATAHEAGIRRPSTGSTARPPEKRSTATRDQADRSARPLTRVRRVAVVGFAGDVGAPGDGRNDAELLAPVVDRAVAAGGIPPADIGVVVSASSELINGVVGSVMGAFDALPGWPPRAHSHHEGDGAWALYEAWVRLLAGEGDAALVCAYSRPLAADTTRVLGQQLDPYVVAPLALRSTSVAALQARALLDSGRYGEADLAAVVSARRPGTTPEELLGEPYVASPLREPDCSTTCAGAAALVLAVDDRATRSTEHPAWITGIEQRIETGALGGRDLTRSPSTGAAAVRLGLPGTAIDVLEVHAPFSHQELIVVDAVDAGEVGALNPSGGALPADPVMATGLLRIGSAAAAILRGDARRTVGHATNGPCLQHNLLCLLEADP